VRLPAIAEENETHEVETVFGTRRFTRRAGEVLHPEREPLETVQGIRATLGEYHFAGQYQQTPAPQGGGMVKDVKFGAVVDVEGSRAIRQAEVSAAKTMIDRAEGRFGLKPERLAADGPTGRQQHSTGSSERRRSLAYPSA
jgi:hypothetical protein